MNPDIVEVTQEDRELFLELFSDDPDDRDGEFTVRDGRWDSDWRMQLLARHRIAALTAARPAIMEPILAALKVVDEAEQPSTWETAVDDLLAAIRAAEVTK